METSKEWVKKNVVRIAICSSLVVIALIVLILCCFSSNEENNTVDTSRQTTPSYPSIPVVYHQTPAVEQSTSLLAYGPHFLEQDRIYSFVFTGTEKVWFNPTHPGDSVAVEIRGKAGRWKQYAVMDADNVIRRGGYTDFVGRAEAGTYSVRLLTPSTTVDFTNTYVNPSGL